MRASLVLLGCLVGLSLQKRPKCDDGSKPILTCADGSEPSWTKGKKGTKGRRNDKKWI